MKVIKRGINKDDYGAEFTCFQCNSIILAKKREGILNPKVGIVSFTCPVCKTNIDVAIENFQEPKSHKF